MILCTGHQCSRPCVVGRSWEAARPACVQPTGRQNKGLGWCCELSMCLRGGSYHSCVCVQDKLPVYGTTARPDLAKKLGFQAAKFPLPYGPGNMLG